MNFPSPYKASVGGRRAAFEEESARLFGASGPLLDAPLGDDALDAVLAAKADCAVCVSDEHALSLLAAALKRGLRVPEDLALTGFDCLPTLGPVPVATSVRTPLQELASEGVAKLRRLIDGLPTERETVLPVSLRVGETT